jgi:hypothetical protein
MKKKLLLRSAALSTLLACGAGAQVVNFHDANNGALSFPPVGYSELFGGQGAYPDPGNDIWNGFGQYGAGYQSTAFYSITIADVPSNWIQNPGNPGNPYSWYTASGNATSGGQWSPVTLYLNAYSADIGGIGNNNGGIPNGSPAFLLGKDAFSAPNTNVSIVLGNVPAGTNYGLYIYGASPGNNGGTTFSLDPANGGNAHNGISSTLNSQIGAPAPNRFQRLAIDRESAANRRGIECGGKRYSGSECDLFVFTGLRR